MIVKSELEFKWSIIPMKRNFENNYTKSMTNVNYFSYNLNIRYSLSRFTTLQCQINWKSERIAEFNKQRNIVKLEYLPERNVPFHGKLLFIHGFCKYILMFSVILWNKPLINPWTHFYLEIVNVMVFNKISYNQSLVNCKTWPSQTSTSSY